MAGSTSPYSQRLAPARSILTELSVECVRNTKSLSATLGSYLDPLTITRTLTPFELDQVFRNLPTLLAVSSKLTSAIVQAVDKGSLAVGLQETANAFVAALQPLLEVYTEFARGHRTAVQALRRVRARPDPARSLAYIASQGRVEGETLESLLLKPFEHAQRMREVLHALTSRLAPADPGQEGLEAALRLFIAICHACDEGGAGAVVDAHTRPYSTTSAAAASDFLFSSTSPGGSGSSSSAATSPTRLHPTIYQALDSLTFAALENLLPEVLGQQQQQQQQQQQLAAPDAAATGSAADLLFGARFSALHASVVGRADIPLDAQIVAAQLEADAAARSLDELESACARYQAELSAQAVDAGQRGGATAGAPVALASGKEAAAPPPTAPALTGALGLYSEVERSLYTALATNPAARVLYEEFLQRRVALQEAEVRLSSACTAEEEAVALLHERLCGVVVGAGAGAGASGAGASGASASGGAGASPAPTPAPLPVPVDYTYRRLYLSMRQVRAGTDASTRASRRKLANGLADLGVRLGALGALHELDKRSAADALAAQVAEKRAYCAAAMAALDVESAEVELALRELQEHRALFQALQSRSAAEKEGRQRALAGALAQRDALAVTLRERTAALQQACSLGVAQEEHRGRALLQDQREVVSQAIGEEERVFQQYFEGLEEAQSSKFRAGFRGRVTAAEMELQEVEDRLVQLREAVRTREGGEGGSSSSSSREVSSWAGVLEEEGGREEVGEAGGLLGVLEALFTTCQELDVEEEVLTECMLQAAQMLPYSTRLLEVYSAEGITA